MDLSTLLSVGKGDYVLNCSFTRCYTLVDEAGKRRQFSLMNGLTLRVI